MATNKECINDIIRRAKSDYFATKGDYKNPHKPGTTEHNAYERGWMQSLKRVKKPFQGGTGSAGGSSFANRYKNMPRWRGPGDDQD